MAHRCGSQAIDGRPCEMPSGHNMGYADVPERHSSLRPKKSDYVLVPSPEATEIMVDALQGELARLREYIELLENQVIVAMTVDDDLAAENEKLRERIRNFQYDLILTGDRQGVDLEVPVPPGEPEWVEGETYPCCEHCTHEADADFLPHTWPCFDCPEDPIPFLPVDPEEQRRLDAKASDGTQCMIYRSN
jgi:hypothetical protein